MHSPLGAGFSADVERARSWWCIVLLIEIYMADSNRDFLARRSEIEG